MKDRTQVAAVSLHISSIFYVLVGVRCFLLLGTDAFLPGEPSWLGYAVVSLPFAMAAGIERAAFGLRRNKYWGWVAAAGVFILFIPTIFLPLGATGLWALMSPATRERFGVGPLTPKTNDRGTHHTSRVMLRLVLLTVVLAILTVVYVFLTGVGITPTDSSREAIEVERVHEGVVVALGGITVLSAVLTTSVYVALRLKSQRDRLSGVDVAKPAESD